MCVCMCVCGEGLARDLLLLCPLGWGGLSTGRLCPLGRRSQAVWSQDLPCSSGAQPPSSSLSPRVSSAGKGTSWALRGRWGRRNSAQSWMSGGCVHVWDHSKLWGQLCDSVLSPLSFLTPGLYPSGSPTRVVDLRPPRLKLMSSDHTWCSQGHSPCFFETKYLPLCHPLNFLDYSFW